MERNGLNVFKEWYEEWSDNISRDGFSNETYRWTHEEHELNLLAKYVCNNIINQLNTIVIIRQDLQKSVLCHLLSIFCDIKVSNLRNGMLTTPEWMSLDKMDWSILEKIHFESFCRGETPILPIDYLLEKNIDHVLIYNDKSTTIVKLSLHDPPF